MGNKKLLFNTPRTCEKNETTQNYLGKPRLNSAVRNQIELVMKSLDELLPKDHLVRFVWQYVEDSNLSSMLKKIKSVEGSVGRPATDPKILLALWLYATVKGIGSARLIQEYCEMHDAFKWICGGVKVNYHTISDFRSQQGELLDELLVQSVGILANKNIISLEEVAQDGMRVRANAGGSSFKQGTTLKFQLTLANMLVEDLRKEMESNPGACRTRIEAAQKRSVEEKAENLKQAVAELKAVRKSKVRSGNKYLCQVKSENLDNARSSVTDPEARIMKMGDGGFRPAYNIQLATTSIGKGIIGVHVTNSGSDQKQTMGMLKQIEKRYGVVPSKWLQDGGYDNQEEFNRVAQAYKQCTIYMPVKNRKDVNETEARKEWRERMSTQEAKETYSKRGETAEFANAQARNRGMQQFLVKGLAKVQNVVLMYAIVHNMVIILNW